LVLATNGKLWLPLRYCIKGNGKKTTWNLTSLLAQHLQSHDRMSYLRAEHFFMSGRSRVPIWARRPVGQHENSSCSQGGTTGLCVLLEHDFFSCLRPSSLTIHNINLPFVTSYFFQNKKNNLHHKGGLKIRENISSAVLNLGCTHPRVWKAFFFKDARRCFEDLQQRL
jgi:hypothetical protein